MTSASKGTSVKKAPAARPPAAQKSGAGAKTSSSRAGTSVPKQSDGKPEAKKDANRTVSKATPASKRAVASTEKSSTARKSASVTNAKSASTTTKKTTSSGAKKTAAPGSPPPAKKVAGSSQKATSAAKGSVAAAGRAAESKKSGSGSASRSAKTATAALTADSESSTSPASTETPGANGAVAPRTTFTPKPKPPPPVRPKTGPYAKDAKFLDEMRDLLQGERAIYQEQATSLRAEADSLALEREPGDVQFDEESGEGGTVTVDRERNLALSGQATMAVEEIDAAQVRIDEKTYGYCERCFQPIPKPRLRALPYARLCVACKSGGLSRR